MKNIMLLLLVFLSSQLAFAAIDPDAVRSAFKRLSLPLTNDQVVIETQYRKLMTAEGVAFTQKGKDFRAAKELILNFINKYDIEILADVNKSYIFKKENPNQSASIKEQFMRLVENNSNRLKFAFTAPYTGSHLDGYEETSRRASRVREAIYPAFYEIQYFYRSYYEKDLSSVDFKMLSSALDFQINSQISLVNEIKDVYDNLSDPGKEIYSILLTILADEGARKDIENPERTNYFLNRVSAIKEVSQGITDSNLAKSKKLYQKMHFKAGILGNAFAPYYFDTIVLLNKDNSSSFLAFAPKVINEKYFLFHGTLAPFIFANLGPEQRNALSSLVFQLSSRLKKSLDDDEFIVVNEFDLQKKRIALVLEIVGMDKNNFDHQVLNMTIGELEKLKTSYLQKGKMPCIDLIKNFF